MYAANARKTRDNQSIHTRSPGDEHSKERWRVGPIMDTRQLCVKTRQPFNTRSFILGVASRRAVWSRPDHVYAAIARKNEKSINTRSLTLGEASRRAVWSRPDHEYDGRVCSVPPVWDTSAASCTQTNNSAEYSTTDDLVTGQLPVHTERNLWEPASEKWKLSGLQGCLPQNRFLIHFLFNKNGFVN
jgi:hypothetical protein